MTRKGSTKVIRELEVAEPISAEREEETWQPFEAQPEPAETTERAPEPEAELTINWLDRHSRVSVRREITIEEMEGWVIGEGIGSAYYVIQDGQRRVLSSVAQAMGIGAVEFLRAEELAKIPLGEPL